MAFDVNGARQAGYSDDDILNHLTQTRKFDVQGAVSSGYSKQEIIDHLSSTPAPQTSQPIAPQAVETTEPGVGSKVMDFLGKAVQTGKDVAQGAVSQVMSGSINTAQMLSKLNDLIKAAATPGVTYKDVREETRKKLTGTLGEGLYPGTPEAIREAEQLAPKNTAQRVGGVIGYVAEGILGGATKGVVGAERAISNALQKSTFRLSGTQQRELGKKIIEGAAETARKLKIAGTPEMRYEKVGEVYEGFEHTLSTFFKSKEVKNVTVDRTQLIRELNGVIKQFADDRQLIQIQAQLRDMTRRIMKMPQKIPVERLNALKRSTFKQAYNAKGTAVRDDVEFALGDVLKDTLENTLKDKGLKIGGKTLEQFNRDYSDVINLKNILYSAIGKQETGVLPRILGFTGGSAFGYSLGGMAGGIAGGAAGPFIIKATMGTLPKSYGANILENLARAGEKVGSAVDTLKMLGKNAK